MPTDPAAPATTTTAASPDRWLLRPEVKHITGFGDTSLYESIKTRGFPAPLRVPGYRRSFWLQSAVTKWMADQVAAAQAQEARGLQRLEQSGQKLPALDNVVSLPGPRRG